MKFVEIVPTILKKNGTIYHEATQGNETHLFIKISLINKYWVKYDHTGGDDHFDMFECSDGITYQQKVKNRAHSFGRFLLHNIPE